MRTKKRGQGTAAKAVTPPGEEGFSLISYEKLIALYANLFKCRIIEERLASARGRGRTNGIAASIRRYEAVTVGVTIDLGSEDAICSPGRGVLTDFPNGAAIDSLLLWSGAALPSNGHPSKSGLKNGPSPAKLIHAHIQAAIGAALANKTRKNGRVAVVFGNESASERWREALHIATVHALPMLFVLRTDYKPGGRSRASDSRQFAKPDTPWFPAITVDSNDVVAVYRVANEAISRARLGRGPTMIECQPYRLRAKFNGNGNHSHDPILSMENYLRGKGLFRPELKKKIARAAAAELDVLTNARKRRLSQSRH
jgi:pyruvate dehydrogenase E1 component alpha subunit